MSRSRSRCSVAAEDQTISRRGCTAHPQGLRARHPRDRVGTLPPRSDQIRSDQINAWCPPQLDVATWAPARSRAWTIVAEWEGALVGFCDLTDEAEVDMLFVAPRVGGRGVAQELIAAALAEARRRGCTRVTTRASRGARAAFARSGFVVDRENRINIVRGILVPNFEMHVDLNGA
ncbi:GNAT family N-acetyltransferase [Brachybacterium sp. GCM10030268]|uniref:GNAT family N-acetyltransferase n=1 Tax=Brachybacterium sp. GCM10030268 TaxID=3273382 RepID=UPI00361526FB